MVDQPLEVRLKKGGAALSIAFSAAEIYNLSAEYLRVSSPSAEVKGHGPGQEVLVFGKRAVSVTALEPVGHYALKITFSDGHETGFYTWMYLKTLGAEQDSRWQNYCDKLQQEGKTRD